MYGHVKTGSATRPAMPFYQYQQDHPSLLLLSCCTLHPNGLHFEYNTCILAIQYTIRHPPQLAGHLGISMHPLWAMQVQNGTAGRVKRAIL